MPLVRKSALLCALIAAAPSFAQSSPSTLPQTGQGVPVYTPPPPPLIAGPADIFELRRALRPRDDRSPRQRCVDAEYEKLGSDVSQLAAAAIDLKCSQR